MLCCSLDGSVVFGNPRTEQHIIVAGCSQASVRSMEALATTPAKLALGLADVLFSKEELSTSLVTKKRIETC